MWRPTLARSGLLPLSAEYSVVNVQGLAGNLSELSDMRHVSEFLVPGSWIWSPCLVVPGKVASGPRDDGIHTRWIWSISPTKV